MSNRFVIVEKPRDYSVENFYDTLSRSYLDYVEIQQAHKQLERGFEAFDVLSNLRNVIKKNNTLSPGLESSLNQTVLFYKDILGDYSTNISFESYSDSRVKRSIALEGIGDWLKRIWQSIINFFKRIWNWLTGKKESSSSNSSKVEEAEKAVEEAKKNLEEARKKREEADRKHAEFLKEMEKAETEKAAFEIEERRKQELEKIAKENEEKNKIAQNEIARQQALIEKLEKEKRDKEALEELAKKVREDERRKKIEEAIKAKDEKINELINNFKQKYENNIAKLQKRIPGHDRAGTFFVTIDRVFSYLLNQISGKMNSVQNYIDDLPKILELTKGFPSLSVGFDTPSSNVANLGRAVLRHDSEVRNIFTKEAYKEEIYLFDKKSLYVTTLISIDPTIKSTNLSIVKAPITLEESTRFFNRTPAKFEEDFFKNVDIKFLENYSRKEKDLKNYLKDWTSKVKNVTEFIEKIQGTIESSTDEYGEYKKNDEVEKYIDDFKEKVPLKHDEEFLDEKRNYLLFKMKVIMETSKNLTAAFPIAEVILSNTIDIFKIINENNVYTELAKEINKIKPANKFG